MIVASCLRIVYVFISSQSRLCNMTRMPGDNDGSDNVDVFGGRV